MNQNQQSKCVAKISSGPRKGKECGNSLGYGKVFCGRHSKSELGEDCIICHESRVNERLDCGHIYHTHCIEKWFAICKNNKCPYCGQVVSVPESHIPSSAMTRSQTTNKVSVKIINQMVEYFVLVRGIENQIKCLIEIFNAFNERVVFVKRYEGLAKGVRRKMEEFRNNPRVLREELRDELFGVFDQLETNMGWKI